MEKLLTKRNKLRNFSIITLAIINLLGAYDAFIYRNGGLFDIEPFIRTKTKTTEIESTLYLSVFDSLFNKDRPQTCISHMQTFNFNLIQGNKLKYINTSAIGAAEEGCLRDAAHFPWQGVPIIRID